MKTVSLTQGFVTKVDDEDFEELNKHKWYYLNGYAARKENKRTIRMHRQLTDAPTGVQVDHVNCDKLDNRKFNLRFCNPSENGRNRKRNRNNSSGFKGVQWIKSRKKWTARICLNRKERNLGYFNTAEEAAQAYDIAAKLIHGEFCYLNFPS